MKAKRKRVKHTPTNLFLALTLIVIIFSVYFTYTFLNQSPNQTVNPESSQPKAAIVDHLSLTYPNQTFIQAATNTLEQVGYSVDYYPGENVTVEFYRNLPTYGYRVIILRVHSSATEGPVTFFTSELYSQTKYVYEQLTDQLVCTAFSSDEAERGIIYFGIRPPFVTRSMNSRFQNTTIIMMGCEGLIDPLMAKALVQKGAKVYISWNDRVSVDHTDLATTHLLQHYLIEERTLKESVQETFKEVGFDPAYNSLLIYYPLEVGEEAIENIKS